MIDSDIELHKGFSEPLYVRKRDRAVLIYILGWGRSGSSILANVLGSLEGAASLGEVRYLWDRGIAENSICGCGKAFADCSFWPKVSIAGRPLGEIPADEATTIARRAAGLNRFEQVFSFFFSPYFNYYKKKNKYYLNAIFNLYEEIFDKSGRSVIIDSSKSPFYIFNIINQARSYDIIALHMVRDPRDVILSWKQKKERKDTAAPSYFPRYSSLRSCLQWYVFNLASARYGRRDPASYRFMRHEDFLVDWRAEVLKALPDIIGCDETKSAPRHMAQVRAQHSITGNPSRFDLGKVTIQAKRPSAAKAYDFTPPIAWLLRRFGRRFGYAIDD